MLDRFSNKGIEKLFHGTTVGTNGDHNRKVDVLTISYFLTLRV